MRNMFHQYWLTDLILSVKGLGLRLRIDFQVKRRTMFIVAWFKKNRSGEKQAISLLYKKQLENGYVNDLFFGLVDVSVFT